MTSLLSTQRSSLKITFGLLCVLFLNTAFAQVEIPKIIDPVTDLTNTIDRDDYVKLRKQIVRFEDSTSNQIVVLIISTVGEDDIREFAIKTLEQNKIGQKGKDNGILLLIAKDDRKVSIEVGYGLEGVLTDAICNQIIRNEILPEFKDGNYTKGISAAVETMILVTKGEYTAEGKKRKNSGWFGVLIVFAVILFAIIGSFRRRQYGVTSSGYRKHNDWWGGGFGGGIGSGGGFGGGGGGSSWSGGGGSFGGGGSSGSW
ncbi:MAG: TPM domain-containing protein [Bacteroidota bacterium]|nr:TPM domain-containing protein [Bacteroidota bacterium]